AGFAIDRKVIYIKEAVKEVGAYKAILNIHRDVKVEIPFEVVAE
ncbi:MAG: 50S ribosomal L9 C-terminal domain-containing protein, partial [Bacteroidales bacterium]